MMRLLYSVAFVLVLVHYGSSEKGCPDDDQILPCKCISSPYAILTCTGVDDDEDLSRVFQNSERFMYKEVHIESSILQYLPHNLFKGVKILELYLNNVTLNELFDSPPESVNDLWKIYLEDVVLIRGVIWRLLSHITDLRYLSIYNTNVRSLGKDFNQNTPKSLEQLVFYGTNTKSMEKGAFYNFTKLNRVEISGAKLTELSRDIFDEIFNGQWLYFNDNKISKIPEDMFNRMPNIKGIMLRQNQLSGLPSSSFDGNFLGLQSLYLDDNPIKCDCPFQWVIKYKPAYITGSCAAPKNLKGREFQSLDYREFNC